MATPVVMSGNLRLTLGNGKIFTAIDCSLSLTRATNQRAANKDQPAGEFTKGEKGWTASLNSLMTYAGDEADKLSYWDLYDLYDDDSDTLVETEFVPDEGDAEFYLKGESIITQMDSAWAVDEDGTLSLSITGSGGLAKTAISTTPPAS
ncbi:hypothetical protein ACOKFD_15645 [Flagellimonas sp. S174]|uniref:hypothetical protein n=1 Tax=Flagellimonas sp. S174 TaxID=3410790 RepID=UPI003BF504CD